MKIMRTVLLMGLVAATMGVRAMADEAPSLTLDPQSGAPSAATAGALFGAAGTTVGWGFTLASGGSVFDVITGSDFCVGAISSPCTNTLGTYYDSTGAQFLVVGPAAGETSVHEAFDDADQLGLGSFAINPGATGSVSGDLVVFFDGYSVDPNSPTFDPDADFLFSGDMLEVPASVTVGTGGGTVGGTTTPEPGTFALLGTAAVGIVLMQKKLSGAGGGAMTARLNG